MGNLECPHFCDFILGTCLRNRRRETDKYRGGISKEIRRSFSLQDRSYDLSNLREDKDLIHSAIFIVFVTPLKAEELFQSISRLQ